jgi:hypothetical protein
MKDLLNKIFTLKGLIFLAVLAVVLSAILIQLLSHKKVQ